jgi:hypothetical protein
MVAQQALQNPWAWKSQFYGASDTHDALIHCARYPEMKTLVNDLVARSDFNRKYATFQVLRDENEKFSPFISYARGIGFAWAGDCRFLQRLQEHHAVVRPVAAGSGDKVKVNTCFYTNGASARIWKKVISEQLGIQEANIQFPADTDEMVDSGPSVLASNSGRMPSQIQRVCELVKQKRFVNPLPLVESVNGFPKSDSLFSSSSWVGMVWNCRGHHRVPTLGPTHLGFRSDRQNFRRAGISGKDPAHHRHHPVGKRGGPGHRQEPDHRPDAEKRRGGCGLVGDQRRPFDDAGDLLMPWTRLWAACRSPCR